MPLAYNLLTGALNVRDIGSNGSAMAVVSGGGPVEDGHVIAGAKLNQRRGALLAADPVDEIEF